MPPAPISCCCGTTVLGSMPRKRATTRISKPPTPPPMAMPRPPPPPPPPVEMLLLSICMPSLKVIALPHSRPYAPRRSARLWHPGAFSFAHYDLVVAVVLGHSTVAHTNLGDLRGATE